MKKEILDKFSRVTNDRLMTLMSPFVVNKEKKTLYFHIAKTGGSSIHRILRNNGFDDKVLSQKKLLFDEKYEYFKDVVDDWDNYYKFTFVRNKFSMLVSLWHYDRGKPKGRELMSKEASEDFKVFIKTEVIPSEEIYNYWIDQYYLTTIEGETIFDFVGHQENFKKDLNIAMNKIGIINYNPKKRVNRLRYNRGKHFSEYYDKESVSLVYEKFKNEIDYFGFNLEK
jgi:hypothetical protein